MKICRLTPNSAPKHPKRRFQGKKRFKRFGQFGKTPYLCIAFGKKSFYMVTVAQLVRAPDCGSGSRGFDPHQSPSSNPCKCSLWGFVFSSPPGKRQRRSATASMVSETLHPNPPMPFRRAFNKKQEAEDFCNKIKKHYLCTRNGAGGCLCHGHGHLKIQKSPSRIRLREGVSFRSIQKTAISIPKTISVAPVATENSTRPRKASRAATACRKWGN